MAAIHELQARRRSILQMIVFTVLSGGIYYPFWFLSRRSALNGLTTSEHLGRTSCRVPLALGLLMFLLAVDAERANTFDTLYIVTRFALAISLLSLSVRVKWILESYLHSTIPNEGVFSGITPTKADLSGALTVLFSIFYLQHVINTRILTVAESPLGLQHTVAR